jgi:hypothetical protein
MKHQQIIYRYDTDSLKRILFFQELKKAEVERYKEEKLNEQHTKMVVKQMKELQELEQRAAQTSILLKGFR